MINENKIFKYYCIDFLIRQCKMLSRYLCTTLKGFVFDIRLS